MKTQTAIVAGVGIVCVTVLICLGHDEWLIWVLIAAMFFATS